MSYEGRRLTASLFDVLDGPIHGFTATALNPVGQPNHVVNGFLRYDLRHGGAAIVVHGTNLTNHPVWLPSGITGNDSVPVQQGRVVYVGLEFTTARN
ncbi:MAG: hypothetical protein ABUS49_11680 [Acidobacteriota bacterium]